MKSIILTIVFSILLFWGCSENSSLISPVNSEVSDSVNKTWIKLPKKVKTSVENEFVASEKINGIHGGTLLMNAEYIDTEGNTVEIVSSLEVPDWAYPGNEWITQVVGEDAASDFYPSMEFINPLVLNITYSGVNLENTDPEDIGFYYIAADGTLTPAENDGISVDLANGTISVSNAIIPHFSRYGFVK